MVRSLLPKQKRRYMMTNNTYGSMLSASIKLIPLNAVPKSDTWMKYTGMLHVYMVGPGASNPATQISTARTYQNL